MSGVVAPVSRVDGDDVAVGGADDERAVAGGPNGGGTRRREPT